MYPHPQKELAKSEKEQSEKRKKLYKWFTAGKRKWLFLETVSGHSIRISKDLGQSGEFKISPQGFFLDYLELWFSDQVPSNKMCILFLPVLINNKSLSLNLTQLDN